MRALRLPLPFGLAFAVWRFGPIASPPSPQAQLTCHTVNSTRACMYICVYTHLHKQTYSYICTCMCVYVHRGASCAVSRPHFLIPVTVTTVMPPAQRRRRDKRNPNVLAHPKETPLATYTPVFAKRLHVYVCVCMCVCTYVCMCVCLYVSMHVCILVDIYITQCGNTQPPIHLHTHVHVPCARVHMFAH